MDIISKLDAAVNPDLMVAAAMISNTAAAAAFTHGVSRFRNDNVTWKTVHSVEKDMEMVYCKDKTYKFSESYNTRYISLIQDEACPGDPPCIAINKIELIGTIDGEVSYEAHNFESEDDDVSIIGHISKNRM